MGYIVPDLAMPIPRAFQIALSAFPSLNLNLSQTYYLTYGGCKRVLEKYLAIRKAQGAGRTGGCKRFCVADPNPALIRVHMMKMGVYMSGILVGIDGKTKSLYLKAVRITFQNREPVNLDTVSVRGDRISHAVASSIPFWDAILTSSKSKPEAKVAGECAPGGAGRGRGRGRGLRGGARGGPGDRGEVPGPSGGGARPGPSSGGGARPGPSSGGGARPGPSSGGGGRSTC